MCRARLSLSGAVLFQLCACYVCFFNLLHSLLFVSLLRCDRDHSETITHDVRSQKSAEPYRYQIDYSAEHGLRDELKKG